MCRFLAYSGPSNTMEELLFNSNHSLVEQSRHARLRFEATNGDGFGVGWYPQHKDPEPGTFLSIEPAWSNRNLHQLAHKVYTSHFFAHIRDASQGMPVSQSNCHPFQQGSFLWMHNGHLSEFEKTRRALLNSLSDQAFDYVDGNTDSEHAFAIFLDQIGFNKNVNTDQLEQAMLNTLRAINELRDKTGVSSNASMNFAVSNGRCSIFTRYASTLDQTPPSLYYSQDKQTSIVASEPLDNKLEWNKVPANHILIQHSPENIEIKAINLD